MNRVFAAATEAKLSRLRHELHLVKEGTLTVKEYVSKIQNICALLEASRHRISEAERVKVMLAGLSSEFDAVVTLASFSSEPLPLRGLVNILLEQESRQQRLVLESPFQVNLTESNQTFSDVAELARGGRSFSVD